ncbi:MAG: rhodanese-like domain-containing protein [Luteolibacter sp.]|uniref:rhodanese-like domain-containing protein n=1 Tax=Luteolibacter sp. TaxID=1962973 RepID=UPI00326725EA
MNSIGQLAAIGFISLTAAGGTFWLKGPPARTVICDPATLKPDEICLQQISPDQKILWVDARHRKDWEKNGLPGSVLWNLDSEEDMQAFEADIATRIMETPRVIVYCGDENCGLSRQVAERIRSLQLGAEVSVLHGGWRALSEAGRTKDSSPKS